MTSTMTPLHLRLQKFAFAAGIVSTFVASNVLLGWAANIPWLTNLSPRFITMKPLTALCFILSAASLCLLMFRSSSNVARARVAQVLALLVALVAVFTLFEFTFGVDLRFENILFTPALEATGIVSPGRLAIASSVSFALLGSALFSLGVETHRGARLAQFLSLCVTDIALLHLLAYFFDFPDLYRTFHGNSMAVHTAALFLILGLGVWAARPNLALAATFNAPGIAGRMARRLLPSAIVLTTAIAFLRLFFQHSGFYGTGFGLAIFTTASITMFALLLFWATLSLNASIEQLDVANRQLIHSIEASNRSNAHLASIVESSDDAIISKTLDGIITSWNAGAERIFGYSAAEAVGQSMHVLLPPGSIVEEADILRRIAAGQSIRRHFEAARIRKDGARILVSITISPLRDSSGVVIGASKVARDITESRRIEHSVAEHEARLAAIIGSAMDGVITVSADQRITMFNPAAETMFGCKASVALGSSLDRFVPLRFRADHAQHIRNFGETNTTRRRMGRMNSIFGVRCNGEEFPIDASISQTEVDGEKLYTVILRDITDRRRVDEEFRQQAALLDLAPVIVRDMDNRIVLWTRGAQQLYGFSRGEALGRNSHELLQTEFPASLAHIVQTLHRDGAWEGELRHRTRDDRTVLVASQWVLHYDTDGKPARILEINSDLTDLKRAQTSQMRSQKLESLGTLAGGVAHDFNNILSAINGNARMALEDLPPHHPLRSYLSEISKAGARAADLVRRILAFSRPPESKGEPISMEPVIQEALSLIRATLPASIQIDFKGSSGLPLVAIDPSQLHQIVVNLATNASHAIGDRAGLISIRLASRFLTPDDCQGTPGLHEGPYVCITVSDDGCGMDRATLDRIFDPFFTTKAVGQGTGLGLSVVHGIVSSYDGAVSVYSQPGKGTSFLLYFPASASSAVPTPVSPVEQGSKPLHSENLLFIDDEEALVTLGTHFLERLGYHVTGHIDPLAALAEFRADPQRFAAVVTDLSMPRLTGFEVARQILSIRPSTPIILASGYVRPEDEQQAASIGIRRILLKPSTIDVLAQALDEILTPAETAHKS